MVLGEKHGTNYLPCTIIVMTDQVLFHLIHIYTNY